MTTETDATENEDTSTQTEELKKKVEEALDALKKLEWSIEFNSFNLEQKTKYFTDQIDEIFQKYSDKYLSDDMFKIFARNSNDPQEINDLTKLIEFENERLKLTSTALEQTINATLKTNVDDAVILMLEQWAVNLKNLKKLQDYYSNYDEYAKKDDVITDEENRILEYLQNQINIVAAEKNKWEDKIIATDLQNKSLAVWSTDVLEMQLGRIIEPQKATTESLKQMMTILRSIENKDNSELRYN